MWRFRGRRCLVDGTQRVGLGVCVLFRNEDQRRRSGFGRNAGRLDMANLRCWKGINVQTSRCNQTER